MGDLLFLIINIILIIMTGGAWLVLLGIIWFIKKLFS